MAKSIKENVKTWLMMFKFGLVIISVLLWIVVLPGCGQSEPIPTIIGPAGADNITEKLILAYDAMDYEAYLENFDELATGSVGIDWFMQTSNIIRKNVGSYITGSKVLMEVKPSGNYTDVTYKAQYSKEPNGVTIIVSLNITDSGTYAVGIWFNSPKLFGQQLD